MAERTAAAASTTAAKTKPWSAAQVPEQSGRVAVITGSNSGIGFETARVLAERGASVVLACRDPRRADDAVRRIRAGAPGVELRVVRLNLASLASVRHAAEEMLADFERIDLLINNAGVMMTPHGQTEDGFDLQLGVNHLGHFALTAQLIDAVRAAPGSRIVSVGSIAHRPGVIDFDDLQFERRSYNPRTAYSQSKLANLLFAYELQRRLAAAGAESSSLAAHPGVVHTELSRHVNRPMRTVFRLATGVLGQRNPLMGALPILRAATDPSASGGEYYGPHSRNGFRGDPVRIESNAASHDQAVAARLWQESERLTGAAFSF